MNSKEIFNYIFDRFNKSDIEYVILHSYQMLPEKFDSDIDIAINLSKIDEAIKLLNNILKDTDWKIIQYWRHENYAADCIISNNNEFLQVDFCIHYERNGRVLLPINDLISGRKIYNNFYIPSSKIEFSYILLKKILKKNFSEKSKIHLTNLISDMLKNEKEETKEYLDKYFSEKTINEVIHNIQNSIYEELDINKLYKEIKRKTFSIKSNFHYEIFEIKRKLERIFFPTGLFIVLLGVDGAGKTTISSKIQEKYENAFRKIKHYHSRVRILKDITSIRNKGEKDVSMPHKNTRQSGKIISIIKFFYYYLDFLIGNVIISKYKIKSSLVIVERYYYDYMIDKKRYNLNLSDRFLKFFGIFIKKPDVIIILTGDSNILFERKKEITIKEIEDQKAKLQSTFSNSKATIFIDTTINSEEECINRIIKKCNDIMREHRKWN